MTNGRVVTDQVILVRDGRIEAVGAADSVTVPAGAKIIDLTSYTVLPGLIDTHTHITSDPTLPPYAGYGLSVPRMALKGAAYAQRTLLAGVTTIRDVGASGFADVAVRDAINDGEIPGPRMLVSGPALGITGGHCDNNLLAPEYNEVSDGVADGIVGVRHAVRRNVKYGVDVIKFCGTGGVFSKGDTPGAQQYTFQEMQALIDEAHMAGRKVAVHAHGAEGIKAAIRAGVDTVEHASLIDDEGLQLAKKGGIYLSMDIYNSDYTQAEGPKRGELEEFLRKDREIAEKQRENFRKAVRLGVKLTFGTDAGVYPHGDNPKQLAYMVRYGMTPMQAIQAATLNGADALGLKDQTGALAHGSRGRYHRGQARSARGHHALEQVDFVMKGGRSTSSSESARGDLTARLVRKLAVPIQIALHAIAQITRLGQAVILVRIDHQLRLDAQAAQRLIHLL